MEEDIRINFITAVQPEEIKLELIARETKQDLVCQQLMEMINQGWPKAKESVPSLLREFWKDRCRLTVQDDLIFKDDRILIPKCLRREMLVKAHIGHMGETNTINFAKDYFFWPGVTAQLKDTVKNCEICQKFARNCTKEPMISHKIPRQPWEEIGIDLFLYKTKQYVLFVDYFSKFTEIAELYQGTTASDTIKLCKEQFARYGIPKRVMTDNGPQFSSLEFRLFAKTWGFSHITSSPLYPQSNGEVERAIQTMKTMLRKADADGRDPFIAMLH